MPEIEVRCCCDPGLLLGWIDLPWPLPRRATTIDLPVRSSVFDGVVHLKTEHAVLAGSYRMAVKSNEMPVEFFRLLPGFREATSDDRLKDKIEIATNCLEPS